MQSGKRHPIESLVLYHQTNTRATASDEGYLVFNIEDIFKLKFLIVRHFSNQCEANV